METYVEGNGENSPAEHADERHDQGGEVSSTGDGQLRGERREHQRAEHQADHSKPVGVFLYNLTDNDSTTERNGRIKEGGTNGRRDECTHVTAMRDKHEPSAQKNSRDNAQCRVANADGHDVIPPFASTLV